MNTNEHRIRRKKPPLSLDNRLAYFRSKIAYEPNGCWRFTANNTRRGYGRLGFNRKAWPAHRFSWFIHFGEIPDGMLVCHKCDNPPCVNPEHLFLGTHLDNAWDKIKKGRTNMPKSVNHPHTKLTMVQAKEAIAMAMNGASNSKIAAAFGVSPTIVSDLVRGVTIPEAIASMPHASKCIGVLRATARTAESNGRAKLTWEIVDSIRMERSSKGTSYRELARKYNVSDSNIWQIIKWHHWNNDLRERREGAIRAAQNSRPLTANE